MLVTKETAQCAYGITGEQLPSKGKNTVIVMPYNAQPLVVFWTNRKNDRGDRLYNVGHYDGTTNQPPLYNM